MILLGLILYYVGTKADINYFYSFSLPILIAGIILSIYGKKLFVKILPVLIFFTISLPILPVFRVTMPFQLLLAKSTSWYLNFIGLNASYSGSLIMLENRFIDIEAGCSGVTSLYSLFVATFMFIYYKNIKLLHKTYIILASFILSLIGNFTRITITSLYILYNGTGNYEKFHENLGIAIFIFLLIVVFIAVTIVEEPENAEQN
ncbi:MAG: exosortase/archaeosortase family protein [Candidatus Aenigmarchaeota archaeon]|nr:exosortase/archaeosortase family protein [Candidatus Aenigmarchaeota archaeon]